MTRREIHNLLEPARFTRAWWLSQGRNLLWVALVTALVWIYADVEFTDEKELRTTVLLVTPPGSPLVLRSKSRVEVTFKAQGRRSSLERVERALRMASTVVRHEVRQGSKEVALREVLNADPLIRDEGLAVLSATPSVVQVELDTKIYVPDIRVEANYGGAFVSEGQIVPPKIGVHVSRRDWQDVLKAHPEPVLRTVRVDLKSVEPGKPFAVDGVEIIRRIADVPVEPDQATVRVEGTVTQLTETQEVTVPVQIVTPSTWLEDGTWKQYVLTRRDRHEWRVQVPVSGTRKDLDQLKTEVVIAYVVLTDDDKKPVSWLTRNVEIRLPRELKIKLVGAPPAVTFKLEKLPPAPGP